MFKIETLVVPQRNIDNGCLAHQTRVYSAKWLAINHIRSGEKDANMDQRSIGNSELKVAPFSFGGNVFGWTVDEHRAFKLLDAFVDAGFTLIDTADCYSMWGQGNSGGESETIIGQWMKARGNRDRVVIATKVGWELAPDKKGLSATYIAKAVEDSLRRLQTDYIDLYQSHLDDQEVSLEETLGAFAQLIDAGKVRVIGASNYTADRLADALAVSRANSIPRYECLQPRYNLYARAEFEEELEPLCQTENIGVIGYSSLASGFLTGKYRSQDDFGKSPRGGRMDNFLNKRGNRILAALDQIATARQVTPTSVALAWLIARPSVTAPIASATSLEQLDALITATTLDLDESEIAALDNASAY